MNSVFSFLTTPPSFVSPAIWSLVLAVGTAAIFWLVSRFVKLWLTPHLCRMAQRLHLRALEIIFTGFAKPVPAMIWLVGLCIAIPMAHQPAAGLCATLLRIVILCCAAWGLWNASDLCEMFLKNMSAQLDLKASTTLLTILKKTYRILVAVFAALAVLDYLGYPVTGLITGFGLAGLTVSLAAQDSASNLFSGLMILIERPFSIGDWITVNGVDGAVEDLTFRSTKVRAMDNSLYVLPNSSVTSATINNSSHRIKRLFRFNLNLSFDSPRTNLESLMDRLYAHLKATADIDPDSVIVRLTGFNESGISILVNAYVLRPDLNEFLDIQNRLNLDIMDLVREEGLHFSLKDSRVYMENEKAR